MITLFQALMWLIALTNFFVGVLLLLVFRGENDKSAKSWALGCFFIGAGSISNTVRHHFPDVIAYFLHNAILIHSIVLFRNSFWQFVDPKFKASIYPLIFSIFTGLEIWVLMQTSYASFITSAAALNWSILYIWIFFDSFRLGEIIKNPFFRLFTVFSFLGSVVWGARAVMGPLLGIVSSSDLKNANFFSFSMINAVLIGQLFVYLVVRLTDEQNKKRIIEKLNASLDQMWRERSELIAARHADRDNLVRDVHDGLGSQLTALHILARNGRIGQQDFVRSISELSGDLHLIVDTLSQADLTLGDGLADMKYRIAQRSSGERLKFHWTIDLDSMPELPSRTVLHILRVVQEAINNALRHADAANIRISVVHDQTAARLIVRVVDDGKGFDEASRAGRGLINMLQRAREIGGTVEIRRLERGTEIVLQRPDQDGTSAGAASELPQTAQEEADRRSDAAGRPPFLTQT